MLIKKITTRLLSPSKLSKHLGDNNRVVIFIMQLHNARDMHI